MISRRQFLSVSAAGLGAVLFPYSAKAAAPLTGWLSGFMDKEGRYGVAHIAPDLSAEILFYTPLRLHGIYKHPTRSLIVAPSRRPDTEMFVFDLDQQKVTVISSAEGRHFYGHGVFSADGNTYYTTENAYDDEIGVIGAYDVTQNFKRIGEMPSGGIGPHEMKCAQDTLVISNGGILTHPNMGRAKLNIDDMQPNLSYLDLRTGKITKQHHLPEKLNQLSIRHMDMTADGQVFIGLQDQLKNRRDLPLVWKTQNDTLTPLSAPQEGWRIFNGYIGSVRATPDSLCVASPRGGCAYVWDKTAPHKIDQKDVCGVAYARQDGFLLTSGDGVLRTLNGASRTHDLRFDNHSQFIG
ncbi:DUF1513 domain-containing protein [Terasakiella pusilla]|uniref:DUF1513 domain-containing protein n=1 Tax=Terasakiella pusilla TaxID=64973 RepID=UPI003AA881D4